MKLPEIAVKVIQELYARHSQLANGTNADRRVLTQMMGEQICALLGDRWGNKVRAGLADTERGKDAIGFNHDDTTVSVWDWQNGTTREPQVRVDMEAQYPNLPTSEARFIPCNPIDHLRWLEEPNPEPSEPDNGNAPGPSFNPPSQEDIRELTAALLALNGTMHVVFKVRPD